MKIKHLYFDTFTYEGEYFNYMVQSVYGKWYLVHIPRTREIRKNDMREIPYSLAYEYIKSATEFHAIVSGLKHTGLELV